MFIEGFVLPLRKVEGLRNVIFDARIFRSTFWQIVDSAQLNCIILLSICPPETLAITIRPNVLQADIDSKAVLTFRQAGHIRGPA